MRFIFVFLYLFAFAFAKTYVAKFSHVVSPSTAKGKAALFFAKRVNELSNGQIEVQIFPSAQLYNDDRIFGALKLNNVQIAAPSLSKISPIISEFLIFDLPYIFKDYDHVHTIQNGKVGEQLKALAKKKGFIAFNFWDGGFKQFTSNKKPLVLPSDIKGQKIRIQKSAVLEESIKSLDASPQALPFSEVYVSMQQGVVDGGENPLSNIYYSKFYEVQRFLTLSSHGYLGSLVLVSQKFWQSLPPDLQDVFRRAMDDASEFQRSEAQKDEEKILKDLQEYAKTGKLQIINLSDAQKEEWKNKMQKIYPKFYKDIGEDLIKSTMDEVKK